MTTPSTPQDPHASEAATNLRAETAALVAAQEKFAAGELTSVGFSDIRKQHLAAAVYALAKCFGVSLQQPLQIDSRGDFSVVVMPKEGLPAGHGAAGHFGDFAAVLNQYQPRTGTVPGSTLCAENGWCYLNHFSAEKMVLEQSAALSDPGK